jgi:RhtB (resistance to homoserine/threonine) family protein
MTYSFISIAIIALLGAISPGPDFALISQNSLAYSRRAGVLSSLGIGVGILFHSFYCIIGIAVIISQSVIAFKVIRYVGAAYLIYLGCRGLLTNKKVKETDVKSSHKNMSDFAAFRQGLLINVLNPKCIVFMISIFTIVVRPHTPYWVQAIYGIELAGITAIWFVFLSFLFTYQHIQNKLAKVQTVIIKILGVFLIGFGLDLIFR